MSASALLLAARVASLNLCTDEYLLLLARPEEIASVSFLSQDPLESPLWKFARRHHANRGSMEQIVAVRPGAVLTMGGGGRASALIGQRLRMTPVSLKFVATLDDVRFNLRSVASALGDPGRSRTLIARLDRLERTRPETARDAIFLGGGGRSIQPGTAGAEWLRLTGLAQRALPGGRATLETLLVRPPQVLIESQYRRGQVSIGQRWLNHPVVRNARSKRVATDGRAWTCMGPLLIGETDRLRAALR
jgi:iron complex transport system substrate-binding protein